MQCGNDAQILLVIVYIPILPGAHLVSPAQAENLRYSVASKVTVTASGEQCALQSAEADEFVCKTDTSKASQKPLLSFKARPRLLSL